MNDAVMAPQPVSFFSLLYAATQEEHRRLDRLIGLPTGLRSEKDLVRILTAWDIVWAEVRAGVQRDRRPAGHDERARLLVSAVRALQRIHADLAELMAGTRAGRSNHLDIPPSTTDDGLLSGLLDAEPGVWAASYVLRGSRINGGTVAVKISDELELPLGVATSYHSDDAIGPAWAAFRRRLDAWGRIARDVDRDQAVTATREAFTVVADRLEAALPAVGRT